MEELALREAVLTVLAREELGFLKNKQKSKNQWGSL